MLSGDTLQMLDYVCRVAREMRRKPFGGLQVILVGDFFQLPPVKHTRWRFAFESPAWGDLDLAVCYLTEQHRQRDPEYLALLASIRGNECDPDDYRLRIRHFDRDEVPGSVPHLDTQTTA